MVAKLELLPNEILIQCFEYFNTPYLFYSFDQLNYRFNALIRHIPLCINLRENLTKSILDKFCIKMCTNPEIRDQVYSLNLPSLEDNDHAGLRTKLFLSFFSLEDFVNLQNFQTNAEMHFRSINTVSFDFNDKKMLEFSMISFSKLRALSIPKLYGRSTNLENIGLTITNLTVASCVSSDFIYLSKDAPMLKYLHVNQLSSSTSLLFKNKNGCLFHLKKLIIDDFIYGSFDEFELFVKFTPNLENLTISVDKKDLIDAGRWEQLITRSLLSLNTFQFKFSCSRHKLELDTMIPKLEEFQSDFWRKEHHWFTEYAIADDSICIYTIPYAFNTYKLKSNYQRHHNNLTNNSSIFDNVTNLRLNYGILKKKCEHYFSNVTSLKLDGRCKSLVIEEIECLRKIVNPFHLQQLYLSQVDCINSSLLSHLLELMPQLSVLSIWQDDLIKYFNDSKLCKCLNKMVKRLYVEGNGDDDLFRMDLFYEVFRNIEHLQFEASSSEGLLFSLTRLPKLSTLKVKWKEMNDPGRPISQIENELIKQNVIYDIKTDEHYTRDGDSDTDFRYDTFGEMYYRERFRVVYYNITVCMWRDNHITCSNRFQFS